jgi:hypothetical protein
MEAGVWKKQISQTLGENIFAFQLALILTF